MQISKVFYSWQSDLPNSTNRGFIETALERAIKSICNDDSIQVEPVIDRDTKDVPGSPDIAETIFNKIDKAAVFICDVSIINSGSKSRLTPNPNVLIELGYAFKALGSERVILVMNTEFGDPEDLPFDLRMRRVFTYGVAKESEDKASERNKLEKTFKAALSTMFTEQSSQVVEEVTKPKSIYEQALEALENYQPNQELLVRKFMSELVDKLKDIAPDFEEEFSLQILEESIEETIELVVEFALISKTIASTKASDAAMAIYKGFEEILNCYYVPKGHTGSTNPRACDFYRFIGHELFVILFSFLIKEERWEMITELLDEDFYIDNAYDRTADTVSFSYVCLDLRYLKNQNLSSHTNRHADLLNERHTQGEIAEIVSMQQFNDADFFLFMRIESNNYHYLDLDLDKYWYPWSINYLKKMPQYLIKANSLKYAQKLLKPLDISSVDIFRESMSNNIVPKLQNRILGKINYSLRSPWAYYDPNKIGTQK